MSDLLLTEHLSTSHSGDEVRQVARARTLTLLPRLNDIRKGEVVQFLEEAGLLHTDADGLPIVDLSDANLNDANLSHLSLTDALLGGLHLRSANFRGANLVEANLGNDDLSFADFRGADL